MNRIFFICFAVFVFNSSCLEQVDRKRPNVLILLADDLGSTDIRCFGGEANTPVLDNLAAQGIKFTRFFAPAPNCSPSRTGLLTGRMPSRVGMYNYRRPGQTMHLPASEITIAEYLQKSGYQTAHFGKWHLSCLPQDSTLNQPQPADQGFEYSLGTENNAIPSHLNPTNFVRNGKTAGKTEGYSCQILANEVKKWFANFYQPQKPFFMYVAFHEVHAKIASPPELIKNYPGKSPKEAEYLANIENMDKASGKILDELKSRNLLENTIVIFASDNGPYKKGSAGNLRGLKGEVYEGGIRIPGIIFWKKQIQPGLVCDIPAGLIDVLPTLSEACDFNLEKEVKLDGSSLMPIVQQKEFKRKTPLMWFFYRAYPEIALRINDYVLVGNALDSFPRTHPVSDVDIDFIKNIQLKQYELYNVETDPGQQNNLAAKLPEIVEEMKPQMLELLQQIKQDGPVWDGLTKYETLHSKFKKEYIRK